MAYPTTGYRTAEARQLSMAGSRNSGSVQPRAAVIEVIPPDPTRNRSRFNTGFPSSMHQTPAPQTSGNGRTITIPSEVRNQIADSLPGWQNRDRLRSSNNLVINLSPNEYRDVTRGSRRTLLKVLLRSLKGLGRDVRMMIAQALLEWLLGQLFPQPLPEPLPVPEPGAQDLVMNAPAGVIVGVRDTSCGGTWDEATVMSQSSTLCAATFDWPEGMVSFPPVVVPAWPAIVTRSFWKYEQPGPGTSNWWRRLNQNLQFQRQNASTGPRTVTFELQRLPGKFRMPLNWTTGAAQPTGSAKPGTGPRSGGYAAPNPDGKPRPDQQPKPDGDGWFPDHNHPNNPYPEPPPARTREKKLVLGTVGRFLWNALNPITEFFDLIDVLFWALPSKIRGRAWYENGMRKLNPYQKAELLYKHWDKVNWSTAVENFAYAQAQDAFYGKLGQLVGKSTQVIAPHRPIGIGTGAPWQKGIELIPQ